MKRIIGSTLILFLAVSSFAQGQEEIVKVKIEKTTKSKRSFGSGIINYTAEDGSWSTKMTLRFQSLYVYGFNVDPNAGVNGQYSNFMIRRARLKFGGFVYTPKLKYKFELGQSSRDVGTFAINSETKNAPGLVFDAVLKWNFYKGFELWAGQTKLPGNRERVISSSSLQLVDRSLLNSNFNIDRDMGVQLHHKWSIGGNKEKFTMKEMFALSQGEGRGITINNIGGFSYTGRVEILPFGEFDSKGKDDYKGSCLKRQEKLKLVIAFGGDYNDRAAKTRGQMGSFMHNDSPLGYYTTNITTLFADLMLKYKGWSLMSEFAHRDATSPIARKMDGTPTGDYVLEGVSLNVMGGYLFKKNWEVTGRYTVIDYNSDYNASKSVGDVMQYTLGVSKYVFNHNLKVQFDVGILKTVGKADGFLSRIQIEMEL